MLAGLLASEDRVCPIGHSIVVPVDPKLLAEKKMALEGGRGDVEHNRRPLRAILPVRHREHIVGAEAHRELAFALLRLALSDEKVLAATECRMPRAFSVVGGRELAPTSASAECPTRGQAIVHGSHQSSIVAFGIWLSALAALVAIVVPGIGFHDETLRVDTNASPGQGREWCIAGAHPFCSGKHVWARQQIANVG